MPYIHDKLRDELAEGRQSITPGELNYQFSTMADRYITRRGLSYTAINEVIGALECAKLELYRRIVAPLEERKRSENGDVYINI
jgi:hypothetical protein